MTEKLFNRILFYATMRRFDPKWKRRMYAICYGCRSIPMLARMK